VPQANRVAGFDRLVPVCARLLDVAATAGEISSGTDAYKPLRGDLAPSTSSASAAPPGA
jgi:hypothetical protein